MVGFWWASLIADCQKNQCLTILLGVVVVFGVLVWGFGWRRIEGFLSKYTENGICIVLVE